MDITSNINHYFIRFGEYESFNKLPDGYNEILKLNLQNDKKPALLINLLALLIMAAMAVIGHMIVPITVLFDFADGISVYFLRLIALVPGTFVYIILHELVHGVCMKCFGAQKINYGLTGLYAYAGSMCYFTKKAYVVIALSPIIVWGIVLLTLNFFVNEQWFWVIYFIQIMNISGAAGDLYVTFKFSKMPKDILVQDTSIEMTAFSANSFMK